MIKEQPYGNDLKAQLKAGARDKLYHFILSNGMIRGGILHGTRMVNEMRANHALGILETLVLGHAYIAAALMCTGLKGDERINLKIDCSGPIKGLSVEANAFGEVRGYLKNVPIPIAKPLQDFNLSPFFGAGFLSVSKTFRDAKQPFTGQVELMHGSIAKDLAYYYLKSEQTPTVFDLSVKFDPEGNVTGAGGLFLQVMPGADEATIDNLETMVSDLPSIGTAFADGEEPEELISKSFKRLAPQFLGDHRIEFMCHCSRDRTENMLAMLPKEDLMDIIENGPFPVEIKCHHCATPYRFNKEDIAKVMAGAKS
ncbi:MAG: Hsp33 family molecular chaperone HslO [Deltaproteobacteria bacterium]|nr:Hsp33 family molecular chaperone HslO [Deltaproteobacteria bacterium]